MGNFIFNDLSSTNDHGIKLSKSVEGKDLSYLNSFSSDDIITFTISAPRRTGITYVSLLLAKDGESQTEYKMPLCSDYLTQDLYTTSINARDICKGEDSGLFYYKIKICVGYDVYYTDSINKIITIDSDFKACIKTLRSIELEKNKSCNIFTVDDEEVFINKKLLVYFNNDDNYYYKGKGKKSPICIYDIQTDHLIGYILPVNPKFL